MRSAYLRLHRCVPKPLRFVTSLGFGDSGFIGNFDEAMPTYASRDSNGLYRGLEGFRVRVLNVTPVKRESDDTALLLSRLWAMEYMNSEEYHVHPQRELSDVVEGAGNRDPLRAVTRKVISTLLVPHWYDLGPWI